MPCKPSYNIMKDYLDSHLDFYMSVENIWYTKPYGKLFPDL